MIGAPGAAACAPARMTGWGLVRHRPEVFAVVPDIVTMITDLKELDDVIRSISES
jgi:hypothetical protein